ncbi:MAG: nuclear transport factor 2 family protein [Parvularculaceae bacterium]
MRLMPEVLVLSAALAAGACSQGAPAPASGDEGLRALDRAYADAWLVPSPSEQERAVLALFDRNAVIMPNGAAGPEEGVSSLRRFWFPDDAPATTVSTFERQIDDIDVSGDLGVVSGRYVLSFTYGGQSLTQKGAYVLVANKTGGSWRISRMIWNDAPLTDV